MTSESVAVTRITVVVAVYNAATTLVRCLNSVASQTYPNTELIVMDGGSSDGSVDILRAHEGQIAYWETQPDRGIYHAWNKALSHATGDWVCFLGADDYFWANDVLEHMVPHLVLAYPQVRVVYGRIAVVSESGVLLRHEGADWQEAERTFIRAMNLPHPGLMHHRQLFDDVGVFDETLRICADYDLLLRELPKREARFVPDVVTLGVQRGGVSYAPASMERMLDELVAIRRKHGIPEPGLWNSPTVLWKMRLCAVGARLFGAERVERTADFCRRFRRRAASLATPSESA